jgi:uncharacterized membrane protein YcaP (DUF421 family)
MMSDNPVLDMLLRSLILVPIAVAWIVIMVRVIGLRSFSKMASFDFAITVAIGSLLATATTVDTWLGFFSALLSISVMMATQYAVAWFRVRSRWFRDLISNDPVVLFEGGEYCIENMKRSRVTKSDVLGKLREANAIRIDDVHAVILEVTGDISVLHKTDANEEGGVDEEVWKLKT